MLNHQLTSLPAVLAAAAAQLLERLHAVPGDDTAQTIGELGNTLHQLVAPSSNPACSPAAAASAAQQLAGARLRRCWSGSWPAWQPTWMRGCRSCPTPLPRRAQLIPVCCGLLEWVRALNCVWPSGGILATSVAGPALVLPALHVLLGTAQLAKHNGASSQVWHLFEVCSQLFGSIASGMHRLGEGDSSASQVLRSPDYVLLSFIQLLASTSRVMEAAAAVNMRSFMQHAAGSTAAHKAAQAGVLEMWDANGLPPRCCPAMIHAAAS